MTIAYNVSFVFDLVYPNVPEESLCQYAYGSEAFCMTSEWLVDVFEVDYTDLNILMMGGRAAPSNV